MGSDRKVSDSTLARIAGNLLSALPNVWNITYNHQTRKRAVQQAVATAREIMDEIAATDSLTSAKCDCGAALTRCTSCVISDYQAAHPDCAACCTTPMST